MKTSLKNDQIVKELRRQIVTGERLPGERLQTRTELEKHFNASTVTVQKALTRLARDGFVVPHGRRGTFVADDPPHLCQYALVFEDHPNMAKFPWSRFNEVLQAEAVTISRKDQRRKFRLYYDIQAHMDAEDMQRLVSDLENDRLAGVIFASIAPDIATTPLFDRADMARVCLNSAVDPRLPMVEVDKSGFVTRALDDLAARGCKRIAMLSAGLFEPYQHFFANEVAKRAMTTYSHWIQGPDYRAPDSARNVVQLLMNENQKVRPDGLIIADDHLIESALVGLAVSGVTVPKQLSIVAHCNFPAAPQSSVPLRRLGFEVGRILEAAVELVDAHRRGDDLPPVTLIPPVFEDERTR